jgi:mannose/fructose/N-acetylgalactosamine-specific phosphotransferase system component IID
MLNLNIIWRLFLIQNSRNEKYHDGLGFFFALVPLFRKLSSGSAEKRREFASRHFEYFNSNPVLAGMVVGVTGNMERSEGIAGTGQIQRVKSALSSALTAKGDEFFEVVFMPLALTIVCIFTIYRLYTGPLVFLLFYNYFHLKFRIVGFYRGLKLGQEAGTGFFDEISQISGVLRGATAFTAGVFTSIVFSRGYSFGGSPVIIAGLAAVAAVTLLRRKYSPVFSVIIVFVLMIILLSILNI